MTPMRSPEAARRRGAVVPLDASARERRASLETGDLRRDHRRHGGQHPGLTNVIKVYVVRLSALRQERAARPRTRRAAAPRPKKDRSAKTPTAVADQRSFLAAGSPSSPRRASLLPAAQELLARRVRCSSERAGEVQRLRARRHAFETGRASEPRGAWPARRRRLGLVKPGERLFIVKGIPEWRARSTATLGTWMTDARGAPVRPRPPARFGVSSPLPVRRAGRHGAGAARQAGDPSRRPTG